MPMKTQHACACPECGSVLEELGEALDARDERIQILDGDLENAERELRSKRAQIKKMRADQDRRLREAPEYDTAIRVLEHWKATCSPNAKELAGKRLENVIARLRGDYSEADLKRAVDGYGLKPYVVNSKRAVDGSKEDWYADAELIFRDAGKVDGGLRIAERADDLRQVLGGREEPVLAPSSSLLLSPLGEAALRMASKGFMVFPCQEAGKAPATRNGLLDAKRDAEAIRKCWSKNPHLNVAVRTGKPSNIVVLDVDGEEGWDSLHRLEDEHRELPTTASVTTPRGGQHFYFRHPGVEVKNTAGFPAAGLDVRGDGGYVLAPPSAGPGGRAYEIDEAAEIVAMPDWLLELLTKRQEAEVKKVGQGRDWGKFISDGSSQGERDNRLCSFVGHMFAHGHAAAEVYEAARVLNAAKVKPPLSEKDLERIVSSIAKAEARKVSV